jgi:hypothetical protein
LNSSSVIVRKVVGFLALFALTAVAGCPSALQDARRQARDYCAAQGKEPVIVDSQVTDSVWRGDVASLTVHCVDRNQLRWWLTGVRSEKDPAEEKISRGFPAPVSSEHLQVINAGYYLVHKERPGEIYYWFQLNVVKPFASKVYTQSELEDPEHPATPIRYGYYLNPGDPQTRVIHGPLQKVALGHRYLLKLDVYEDPEHTRLLEHLEQAIEAPFDNRSGCVELSESAKRALSNSLFPPDVCGTR